MIKKFKFSLIIFTLVIYSCSDNSVNNTNKNEADTYQKINTIQNGNLKFEVWAVGNDTLMTGYNKVGFKVFVNDTARTVGFVKFYAKMFHFTSQEFHATPVEPEYYFNSAIGMFTGYIIMMMPSDTTSRWYGYYNYNDELSIDSVNFDVGWNTKTKFKIFTDIPAELSYLITMTSPENPVKGINDFSCLLHESHDFVNFTEVKTAQMFISPVLDSLSHISEGNVNPVYTSGGIYKGKVNFDYTGGWKVYDSIYYNNRWITESGVPYLYFEVR